MGDGLKLGLDAANTPIPDGLGGTRKLPTAIVLLSDGASTTGENDPIDVAQAAKKAKIKIYTVALGTPSGVLETTRPDGSVKRENVPPDTLTLQEIARDTGGRYFNAPDADQLQAIYSGLATRFATVREKQEMTAAFAGGGLVLLIGGLAFSLVRGGRLP
jgi:Ca-activated chloride channel family protein